MPKAPEGTCHICGENGPLTFEHVPPKAAFNDRKVEFIAFNDSLNLLPGQPKPRGRQQQKGAGGYTLCGRCNNYTGRWYVKHFAAFCQQAQELMYVSQGRPTLAYPYYIFPLPVIKQIVSMFLSVNNSQFQEKHQELVSFVLIKERMYLSPKYRFFVHYVADPDGGIRSQGMVVSYNAKDGRMRTFSEITFPPLGYVMTVDSSPPSESLLEITHFARFSFDDLRVMQLQLPVLPTHLAIPGDYRSKEEILEQFHRSQREARSSSGV